MKPERQNQLSRCVSLMTALAPHIVSGLTVTELAEKTRLSTAVVCRDMDSLNSVGWAQKLETGRWALTTKPIALAAACDLALKTARERQDDFKRNVSAGAFRLLEK
jgi:DNA-binding IclR family transcriptional regulator